MWSEQTAAIALLVATIGTCLPSSAIADAPATAPAKPKLWLLPAARPMPTSKLGPFVRLADGGILTVDKESAFISRDEGRTWSEPIAMFSPAAPALISEERAIVVARSGAVIVAFENLKTRNPQNWDSKTKDWVPDIRNDVWTIRSTDNGRTWSDAQLLQSGYCGAMRGMTQAANGNIVITTQNIARNPARHVTTFYFSRDDGKNWQPASYVDDTGASHASIDIGGHGHHDGAIEPTVELLKDGRLWMLIRTGHDWFWQAFSEDNGVTWKHFGKSTIAASAAPGLLKRLADGRLLLLWNQLYPEGANSYARKGHDWHEIPASYHREELSAAVSDDDGKSWRQPIVIARQRDTWLSYPYVFERAPGELWITTMQGGLRLALHEKDLRQGLILVKEGQAQVAIHVAPRVMEPDGKNWKSTLRVPALEAEIDRQRLRESVKDLSLYLEKMSGAKIDIVTAEPKPDEKRAPILIGEMGEKSMGPVDVSFAGKQGFRVVVRPGGVGLMGESDLATSYAIYELLDRLGCRWFMPGEMGEVVPEQPTITLQEMDLRSHPSTICRRIDYVDDAYKRRNRTGGLYLFAQHALEGYITKEQRQQHPQWCATVGGKLQATRLKWSNPEVADAIATRILAILEKTPAASISISPYDGSSFDDSPQDRALDANDFDAAMQTTSITDRYLVLCNRIAARVTAEKPDVLLGMLAYVQYTRPPVREKVAPNIVPMIAPITFSRAHPMTDDAVPGNKDLRYIVQGWGKAARMVSYYAYGYYLAEVSAPNPMITKWSIDTPLALSNNCAFWMPETMPNFETCMPALYMANRLAWDSSQQPGPIIDELMQKFYGHAAREMTTYWRLIDDAWIQTPEYSGCMWGYGRRFTPAVMAAARQAMDAARAAARTPAEKSRIEIADLSLEQFELYMKLRWDLADGHWATIEADADRWRDQRSALTKRFAANSAFGPYGLIYFDWFCRPAYKDAARIARDCQIITAAPLRHWRYAADPQQRGEAAGWFNPEFDGRAWKTTDPCIETWSTLGYHDYLGTMWYRTTVDLPSNQPAPGKKTYLWLGNSDGTTRLFVNGKSVKYIKTTQQPDKTIETQIVDTLVSGGFQEPASFDITEAIRPGMNQITFMCTRTAIDELGVGGLMGPVVVYSEK